MATVPAEVAAFISRLTV